MKHAHVSFGILTLLTLHFSVMAQTTYTINSSTKWSSKLPATCYACTINIGTGATLTIDESATCQNCTFAGGTVSITSQSLNIQYSGPQTTTYFNGTTLVVNGTGSVVVNAPLSLTSSIFDFNNNSSMTTSYDVSLTASTIYLYDNASMTSNGGASTTIDLMTGSRIVIGNGSLTSASKFTVSGPTVTLYDNSSIAIANQNNVFYNWSNYMYQKNDNANGNSAKSYATSGLGMNCGAGYAHACSNPSLYGPATMGSGVTPVVTLPVVMDGFTADLNSNHSVSLYWNTQVEQNFNHFTIQRSADGSDWDDIGTVQAMGNSNVQVNYSFTDEQPLSGTNYYRLALVNDNNSYAYSDIKVLQSSSTTIRKVSFFPNPAKDYVNVSLDGEHAGQVTILLSSIGGQLIQEKTAVTGNGTVVSFPIHDLAAGMYVLSVLHTDGSHDSSPVMITR